jgi:hypothetical protein
LITLNLNQGLVKVASWDDIESLPGYKSDLSPKNYKLKEIIGRYIFKDYVRCGLSTCHTPHGKGYIVTTTEGAVTNIGKDCGKKHFGVEFETLSKKLELDIRVANYRETLGSFMMQLESYAQKLDKLRSGDAGADKVYKNLNTLMQRTSDCPESVVLQLRKCVRERNTEITRSRLATEQEIEDIEAIENRTIERPHYLSEPVATLAGISCLYPENDLREKIVVDLQSNLKKIETLDIDKANTSVLKHWSDWVGQFDNKIENVEEIISSAHRFLDLNNLKKLKCVLTNDSVLAILGPSKKQVAETKQFEKLIKKLAITSIRKDAAKVETAGATN